MHIDDTTPGNDSTAGTSVGDELETDFSEVKAFIQREGTVLLQDVDNGILWLKNELMQLAPEVQADLKVAVGSAATEAMDGATSGSIVADTLTILARDGAAVLSQVKSDVLTAVVGLTTAKPAS